MKRIITTSNISSAMTYINMDFQQIECRTLTAYSKRSVWYIRIVWFFVKLFHLKKFAYRKLYRG